jgi:flagellar biosynthesis/type III secretory pathway M-ring protein FliF/YscJ
VNQDLQTLIQKIADLVRKNPDKAAIIISTWMKKKSSKKAA